jgi:hypothetical protein
VFFKKNMSQFKRNTTPAEFRRIQRKLLYDGPREQETRIINASKADLNQLQFSCKGAPGDLLCADVFLEVGLTVQKQQINIVDREVERTRLDANNIGVPFDQRTKRYVPMSVPFDHVDPNLQDPDEPIKKPNPFVGVHASDGMALQQNMKRAHMTFKTITIDERPSEYLTPLIQLHGDQ